VSSRPSSLRHTTNILTGTSPKCTTATLMWSLGPGELWTPEHTHAVAFFIACEASEVREVWRAAMGASATTGRYPVVTYAADGSQA
jgi:hypothetical protein